MTYTFSKRIIDAVFLGDPIRTEEQTTYKVFEGERQIGEYYYTAKECRFNIEERKFRLNIRKRFMQFPRVSIIDESSGEMIGKIRVPYTHNLLWASSPDELKMGEVTYLFRELKPDVKFSFFKKETHGYFKFSLAGNGEEINYTLKIDYSSRTRLGGRTSKLSFEGSIDCRSKNLPAMFAAFYLIEIAFDRDENG